jgi:arylsulfatase A-like enzyme
MNFRRPFFNNRSVATFCAFLALGMTVHLVVLPTVAAESSARRPNIVFFLTDDQQAEALVCYGNSIIQTPNIDALAKTGVAFDRAFVTTAICMTSRASILTGQYAARHGIHGFGQPLSDEQFRQSYPAILRRAGYRVAHVGKWHLDAPPSGEYDFLRWFRGTGWFYENGDRKTPHLTGRLGDDALEFLDGEDGSKPFCLTVAFKAPHVQDQWANQFPYDRADPRLVELYRDVTIPEPKLNAPEFFDAQPDFLRDSENRVRWGIRFVAPSRYQRSVKNYYRLLSGVDREVGRVVAKLEEKGLADNTVIIYTSDHGYYLGERGFAGKWFAHDLSMRIPLVIHDPRALPQHRAKRVDQVALNIDLAATILGLAGLEKPEGMQGESLLPLLQKAPSTWRTEFFYEHRLSTYKGIPQSEGVRTLDWKYIRWFPWNTPIDGSTSALHEELYDLRQDPDEANNMALSPAHHAQLAEMRKKWRSWRERAR